MSNIKKTGLELLLGSPADVRVLVQGITGTHGAFHTAAMLQSGSPVLAGVTPGKGGQVVHGLPVYDKVSEAMAAHSVNVSVLFVPAPFAKAAALEAIEAGIKTLVIITEHIPVHDMVVVLQQAEAAGVTIIGPNCPGVLIPGEERSLKLGIVPQAVAKPGKVAVVSRSGTLTYEAAASLSAAGIGQRAIVGIGGDRLRGASFVDCLRIFEADAQTESIILIGEIGGQEEQQAAECIAQSVRKPVYAYVVGHSAPPQTQLGHAGAIMGGANESAAAKTAALHKAGAITADSLPALIGRLVQG